MNKFLIFFIAIFMPIISADAAVAIKKAAPVATKPSAGTDGAASLVPSVIGLVSGVMEMNAKQRALSDNCIPSSAEITFIDNSMKEWAKSGQMSLSEIKSKMGKRASCKESGISYKADIMNKMDTPGILPCYDSFFGAGNEGMIWENYPKVGKGTYCKDGMGSGCTGNNAVTLSDAYDLFGFIDFGPADYTRAEATMAGKLLSKMETCSNSKINAKKKALWGEFLTNTAGSLGQKTNTGSIMDSVGAISGGGIGSLGSIATQFMPK